MHPVRHYGAAAALPGRAPLLHIRGVAVMHRLTGHAIVSLDDRIADRRGRYPPALRNERDWALFQAALDAADLTLLGRLSHEAAANVRGRRRLVVSSRVRGLERRSDAWWLNPADMPLAAALDRLLPGGGDVAVPGGQAVFDLVGPGGFAAFHLARSPSVRLPAGRGLFAACETGSSAEALLMSGGLVAGPSRVIDPAAGVTLTVWMRP